MKERPIIFNADMVRAVLDGRKTQTRRIIQSPAKNMQANGQKVIDYREPGDKWYGEHVFSMRNHSGTWCDYTKEQFLAKCPFGAVGDRLWVREAWQAIHDSPDEHGNVDERTWMPSILKKPDSYWHPVYGASWGSEDRETRGFPWRPSLHMPRWASRITLEITGVRVERLNDISEDDAKAEGAPTECCVTGDKHFLGFRSLWRSIYGADSWQANPWVWVIEFKRVEVQ
ncbi:hypothetical protein CRM79_05270 [Pantoea agglomerans]|nr:hypothetical protein [Pantoea agglomerans]PEI02675.1 hypothetical protein CRM79_05270 [Pantoea agglomerans]